MSGSNFFIKEGHLSIINKSRLVAESLFLKPSTFVFEDSEIETTSSCPDYEHSKNTEKFVKKCDFLGIYQEFYKDDLCINLLKNIY